MRLHRNLRQPVAAGQVRKRREMSSPQGPVIILDNRKVDNFCSNDYLGLANHPALKQSFRQGVDDFGVGAGASQLICGYTSAHRQLEEKICAFTERQRAVLFSSGYLANLAIVNVLLDKSGIIFGDRLNHASTVDAALLSRAHYRRYRHADPESLRAMLDAVRESHSLVITDGVFSMDGDIAPLQTLAQICAAGRSRLVVDDAHGFGVLGATGAGTVQHYGLTAAEVPVLMATFGKALGTAGAFVAGNEDLIGHFVQSARPLIYSTAPPPALALATLRSLELIEEESWRRDRLRRLVERFKQGARHLNLPVAESMTPIQPLMAGSSARAVRMSDALLEAGVFVAAIRPPTVPESSARLRITLTAAHTEAQVDRLLELLPALMKD